jgi:heat shock protein HtpX
VERLCKESGVPEPRIAIIESPEPNAFVFGVTANGTYLVVHDSLLRLLTKEEVETVLAHEIGHLKHKDCSVMTVASSIPLLTYLLARGGFELMRHSRPRGHGKGSGGAILAIIAIAAISYLVYLVTQLLVLYLSRSREYYADAHSAEATKNPAGLQSALIKLMTGLSLYRDRETPSALRAFYAMDPVKVEDDTMRYRQRMDEFDLNKDGVIDEKELEIAMQKEGRNPWRSANELFSTHPNIYKRVLMLRRMELDMEAMGSGQTELERPQTPAEKDFMAGPMHMGGGSKDADISWKD